MHLQLKEFVFEVPVRDIFWTYLLLVKSSLDCSSRSDRQERHGLFYMTVANISSYSDMEVFFCLVLHVYGSHKTISASSIAGENEIKSVNMCCGVESL